MALAIVAALALTAPALHAQPQYNITTLFDVAGLQGSHPLEINDNGQVVGLARFADDDRQWGWRQDGATIVLARPLMMFEGHAAPTLSGHMLAPYLANAAAQFERTRVVINGVGQPITNPAMNGSEMAVYGLDVNERGQAVGYVLDVQDPVGGPFAFLWQNGTTVLLDDIAPASVAAAVNDHGTVAGSVMLSAGGTMKPVIWWNRFRVVLSPTDGAAHHVNNADVVLGQFQAPVNKAFLWEQGTLIDPCPSLPQCVGMHLNEAGQALVRSGTRSYIYDSGVLTDIGVLGPGVGTFAHTLIDSGAVVGYSSADGSYVDARAVVYLGGMLHDLNAWLPPGSGWTRLIDAIGINNHGHIVGIGLKDGVLKTFLMAPVP